MHRRLLRALVVIAVVAAAIAAVGASPAGALTITPVTSGLDNPRGMAFGPNGALYVAEAGEGGSDFCVNHAGLGPACAGMSGAVTRIWRGKQERILTQLPSIASADGAALGPNDVSPQGTGSLYIAIGLGDNPAVRAMYPPEQHRPSGGLSRAIRAATGRRSRTSPGSRVRTTRTLGSRAASSTRIRTRLPRCRAQKSLPMQAETIFSG